MPESQAAPAESMDTSRVSQTPSTVFAPTQSRSQSTGRRPSPMYFSPENVPDPERTPRMHDLPKIISTLPTPRRLPSNATSEADRDYFRLQNTTIDSAPGTDESPMSDQAHTPVPTSGPEPSVSRNNRLPPKNPHSTESVETLKGLSKKKGIHATESAKPATEPPSPAYPNQAYSALQQYSRGLFMPRSNSVKHRNTPLHPVQGFGPHNVSQSLASRSAGNSPAPIASPFDASSAVTPNTPNTSAPFSHLSTFHTSQPKETHIADIDVDPVSGRKLINHYEIIGELGRGVHGKVKLGRSTQTGQYVAIKIVERYAKQRRLGKIGPDEDKVKREVAILKKVRHSNIVALLEVIDDPARSKVYIVLERVDLGEISWRTDPTWAREVALVEYRRYERESRGSFDDAQAQAEDAAIMERARAQRVITFRAQIKRVHRRDQDANDAGPWSLETAGGINDDSDLEGASRGSVSAGSQHDPDTVLHDDLSRSDSANLVRSAQSLSPRVTRLSSFNIDTNVGRHSNSSSVANVHESSDGLQLLSDIRGGQGTTSDSDAEYDLQARVAQAFETEILPDLHYVPLLTMEAARSAFRDTLLGLLYLHYHGIIHRDIKPPNLLQTRDHRIKISDFGVSYLGKSMHDEASGKTLDFKAQSIAEAKELAKTVGTAAFFAPELCYMDNFDEQPPVGKAIDVWALGITLFCMLFARVPIAESSEYVTMRRIADEHIYIPKKRLLPAGPQTSIKDIVHPHLPGTRPPAELEYEELDEDVRDLLRRLLNKNPLERITLEEVRHHPWVVADVIDKEQWLEQSDPTSRTQGEKIKVTKEEVEQSMQPINFVGRIRSGIKKAVAASFGLARSNSTRKKEIAHSASTPSGPMPMDSSQGEEIIVSALKASRDADHPLSQSLTSSPQQPSGEYFMEHTTALPTPAADIVQAHLNLTLSTHELEREASTVSTRPQKTYDIPLRKHANSELSSPALSLDSPGGANLSALLGGASRLLKSVRGRKSGVGSESRERSSSRASSEGGDSRANATLAISTASAAGEIDAPDALRTGSTTNSSAAHSLSSSPNMLSHPTFVPGHRPSDDPTRFSRQRSSVSASQVHSNTRSRSSSRLRNLSTEEDFHGLQQNLSRRRRVDISSIDPSPAHSRHSSVTAMSIASSVDITCSNKTAKTELYHAAGHVPSNGHSSVVPSTMPSLEASPMSVQSSIPHVMTPDTSIDRMADKHAVVSPSRIASHAAQNADHLNLGTSNEHSPKTPQTARRLHSPITIVDEDAGYVPDPADESAENDSGSSSSGDDDGGLQMGGPRSGRAPSGYVNNQQ